MKTLKEKVKERLEVERCGKRCQRALKILENYLEEGEDFRIVESSDFHWAERKNRPENYLIYNIGAAKYGSYSYYIYLVIIKKKEEILR